MNGDGKFIVDFDNTKDMLVHMELLVFIDKLGICRFRELRNLEHWFSDIMIVEFEE
jgi:hypothetical protein